MLVKWFDSSFSINETFDDEMISVTCKQLMWYCGEKENSARRQFQLTSLCA